MAVTIESLHAACLVNQILVITTAKMSGMAPQIKGAFKINMRQMIEVGLGTEATDNFLGEVEIAFQRLLKEL